MRGWGFAFIATAASAVFLAQIAVVIAFWLIGIVSAAALLVLTADYADRRVQREVEKAVQR